MRSKLILTSAKYDSPKIEITFIKCKANFKFNENYKNLRLNPFVSFLILIFVGERNQTSEVQVK